MSKRVVHFKTTTWDGGWGGGFVPICKPYAPNEYRILHPLDMTPNARDVTCKSCLALKTVRLLLGPEWPNVKAMSLSFRLVGAEWREKRQPADLKSRQRPWDPVDRESDG